LETNILGGVILQIVSALFEICLMTILILTQGESEIICYDIDGIPLPICILAGVSEFFSVLLEINSQYY